MGMNWSPLAYFKELHLLPRVIFAIGWTLFLGALVAREFAALLFGVSIILGAVGFNFLLNSTWHDTAQPYKAHVSWLCLFQAFIAISIAAVCFYVAAYRYRYGMMPPCLRSAANSGGALTVIPRGSEAE